MATTTTVIAVDQVKGPSGPTGELHFYQVVAKCAGTYATASKPSFDVLAALQAQHEGVSAVSVKSAIVARDAFNSSGARQTSANSTIALSGTGNKTVTFAIHDTGTNGGGTNETADGSTTDGEFTFLVAAEVTKS